MIDSLSLARYRDIVSDVLGAMSIGEIRQLVDEMEQVLANARTEAAPTRKRLRYRSHARIKIDAAKIAIAGVHVVDMKPLVRGRSRHRNLAFQQNWQAVIPAMNG